MPVLPNAHNFVINNSTFNDGLGRTSDGKSIKVFTILIANPSFVTVGETYGRRSGARLVRTVSSTAVPSRNQRTSPDRLSRMGQATSKGQDEDCQMAVWTRRNGQERHRADTSRGIRGRGDIRRKLLLFAKQRSAEHPSQICSNNRISTRTIHPLRSTAHRGSNHFGS